MAAPLAVTNATYIPSKKSHKCVIDVTDNPSSSRLRVGSKSRAASPSQGTTGLSQAIMGSSMRPSKSPLMKQEEGLLGRMGTLV